MELREILIEDVFPDAKNPRRNFGDIKALAESCMLNTLNPGEPVNPIVVVVDGGIYRIVDGGRRYMAMIANKLTRCHAVVCEDMDEASAMVAMVATDDKERLTDIERSRGVQQMLLCGVDPAKVERVGRMAKGSAAKLRRAREAVDDAGDDMTLDRMLAIAEFAEAGDDDAVSKLTNCREVEWERVASDIRADRKHEAACELLRAACADAGIALEDKAPSYSDYTCCAHEDEPDGITGAWDDLPEGSKAWLCETSYGGPEVRFYRPSSGADPEAEEQARAEAEMTAKMQHGCDRRAAWFARCVRKNQYNPTSRSIYTPTVDKYLVDYHFSRGYDGDRSEHVEDFCEVAGIDLDDLGTDRVYGRLAVLLYTTGRVELGRSYTRDLTGAITANEYTIRRMDEHLAWVAACIADGYEMDETDAEVEAIINNLCEAATEENNEEGE